jgi:predicted phosphoribosyltransferase
MAKTNKIAAIIFGAAVGVALVKFLSMPKEERNEFYDFLKDKTRVLLDNAEDTVEKVEQYMDEFKEKGEDEWIDKIYILKKMFKNLYGSGRNYLL